MNTTSADVVDAVSEGLAQTPLLNADGVTFVYVGSAEKVEVLVMEDRFPRIDPMQRVDGADIWFATSPLDSDGCIEYKLAVTTGGKRRLILDPANDVLSTAPFGSNSVACGPSYEQPTWLDEDNPQGTVVPFPVTSKLWGLTKNHQLYLPPDHEVGQSLPLLVMHDGPEFLKYAGLSGCLDSMIAAGRIPSMAVLLHQPHSRNAEYVDNPTHSAHLVEEVLPALSSELSLGSLFAAGASLGAVASMSAAFANPGTFQGLMLQSGSFVTALGGPFKRGRVLEPITHSLPGMLEKPDRFPTRMVLSCGTYDGLVEDHRELVPRLAEMLPETLYEEIHAGHHWRCWRDRLEPDLFTLLNSV